MEQLRSPRHREQSDRGAVLLQLPAGYKSLLRSPLGQESHQPLMFEFVPAGTSDRNAWALHLSCVGPVLSLSHRWVGRGGRGPALLSSGYSQKGFHQKLNFSRSKTEFLFRLLPPVSTLLFHILSCLLCV